MFFTVKTKTQTSVPVVYSFDLRKCDTVRLTREEVIVSINGSVIKLSDEAKEEFILAYKKLNKIDLNTVLSVKTKEAKISFCKKEECQSEEKSSSFDFLINQAFYTGYTSFLDGDGNVNNNPYPVETEMYQAWIDGLKLAEKQVFRLEKEGI